MPSDAPTSGICGDSRWPTALAAYQHTVAVDRVHYPMYGAFAANIRLPDGSRARWPDGEDVTRDR
ncbi:hypothetical protein SAZ_37555 [Streptomyces noursei ZPM]|uniref:hypothetical protein n=1 Tax=Streptomyces noursei TaxID=1971 RepID=UPI000383C169|nr:hypothetical protein [Streptomyces noursei]AKA09111.1 hypothetical protein SAZ_37555 [Streptomyces noursei ZPM]EPY93626.1 hypothetical protein K530_47145 [Streptomyces noursei CCRC 11814]EXU88183.1 hypothetical protein P354_31365 [Streptomyces noursei PD-1]UWS76040.1 hypothetical protein N1H47_35265 [Streptomyces noursei]